MTSHGDLRTGERTNERTNKSRLLGAFECGPGEAAWGVGEQLDVFLATHPAFITGLLQAGLGHASQWTPVAWHTVLLTRGWLESKG